MGLPDPGSAKTWGGKLLVDRNGAEIGICTEIFIDDATGLPEWATADVTGGTAFIPLLDAVESGDRVRVAVQGVDVADAPPVGNGRHLSEDEEERLYRHYGIEYSRSGSSSGLPANATPSAVQGDSSTGAQDPWTPGTAGSAEDAASGQPGAAVSTAAQAPTAGTPRVPRLLLLGLGIVVSLGAVAGAVLRRRRRPQPPPSRAQRFATSARAASFALDTRGRQALAATVPVLQSGTRLSVTAAQRAATQAAIRATAAAEQASARASRAAARARASCATELPEPPPPVVERGAGRRMQAVAALTSTAGFGAGYLVGSRAAGTRLEQVKQATATWSQRPAVQQARTRVRTGLSDTLQVGNARLTRTTANVTGKLRRRGGDDGSPAGDAADTASGNGSRASAPESP